ncbi:serine-rich adhesin for platelets isoform X2 [Bactrocera dorsalis]|uniref:Serine-rich adhesin for platelets isoform X2 n=1 Tax=Bactrocera dorsalis TaxID=27457 RepID=A0ABM3JG90_BACDO|nr:serine-rich adhesin for platelets isoform X2 [Bactrocera dorsalis]
MRRTRPHLQEISSPSTASPLRTRQRTTSSPSLESPDEQLIIETGEHSQPYSPSDTIESMALSSVMSTPVEFIATEESLPVPDVLKVKEIPPEAGGSSNQLSAAQKEKHIAGGELSPICISSESTNDSDCVVVDESTQPKKEQSQRKRRASPYHYHFWRPRSPFKSFKKKKQSESREREQSASGSRVYAKPSVESRSTQNVIAEAKKTGNYSETSARKKDTKQPKNPNTDSNIAASGDNKPKASTKQTKEDILETKSVNKESNSPQKSTTDETKLKASIKKRKKAKSKKRHATKSKASTQQASVQISEEQRIEKDSNPAQKSSASTNIKVRESDGNKSKHSSIPTKAKVPHEYKKEPQKSLTTSETKHSKTSTITKDKKDGKDYKSTQDTLVSTKTLQTKDETQTARSVTKTDSKLSERTTNKDKKSKSTEPKTSSVPKNVAKAGSDSKRPSKSAESKETERQLVSVVTERADIDDNIPKTSLPKAKETKTAQKMSFVDIVKALMPRIKSRRHALTISQEVAARINRQPLYQPQSLTSRLLRSVGVQTAMNWYHIIPLHRDASTCSLRELIRIAVQYERQVLGKTATHNLPIHIAKCPQRPLNTIRPDISAATTSRSAETDLRWFELVQVLESPGQRFYCRAILPRKNTSSGQTTQLTAGNSQTTGESNTTRQTRVTTAQAPHTTQSRVEVTSTATQYDLQTTTSNVAVGTDDHDPEIVIRTDVAVGTDNSQNIPEIPEARKVTAATQTQPISTKTQSTSCDVPEQVNAATQYDPPPLVSEPITQVLIETTDGEVNTLARLCQLTMSASQATHTSVQTTGFEVDTLSSLCRVAMSEPASKHASIQTIGIEVKTQATLTDATERPTNEQFSQWEPHFDVVDISNTPTNSKREILSEIPSDDVTTLSSDSSEGPWDVRNLRENINEIDKECMFTFTNVELHSDASLDIRPSTSEPALHRLNALKKDSIWQSKPNFSARRNSNSSSETVELAIWQEIECMKKAKSANVISDTQTTQTASRQQIKPTKDKRCTQNTEHDEKNSRDQNINVQNQPPNFNELALQRPAPFTPIQRIPCVSLDRLLSTKYRDVERQITRRYSDSECGISKTHLSVGRQLQLIYNYVSDVREILARREVINNLYAQLGNLNPNIVWAGRLSQSVDINITIRHILGLTSNITDRIGDYLKVSEFCSLKVLQDNIANLTADGEIVLSISYLLPQNAKFTEGYEIVFSELKATLKESKVAIVKREDIEVYLYPLDARATFNCGTHSEEWIEFLNNEHRPDLLLAFIIHSKRMMSSPFSDLFDQTVKRGSKASQIITGAEAANQSNTEGSKNNGSEVQNQMKSEENVPDPGPSTESSASKATEVQNEPTSAVTVPEPPSRQPSTESSASKATEVQNEPRSAVTVPDSLGRQPSTESSANKSTEVQNEPRSTVTVPEPPSRQPKTESCASNNTEVTNQTRTKDTLTDTIGKRKSFESAYDGDISQFVDGLSHTEVTPVNSAPEYKRVTEKNADANYENTPNKPNKARRMKRRSKLPKESTSSPPTTESTDKSIKDEDGLRSKGSAKRKQSLKKRRKREVSLLTPPLSSSFYQSERLAMRRPENSGNENNVISVPAVKLSRITNLEIVSHPFQETPSISRGSVSESQNQAFPRMRRLTSSSSVDENTLKMETERQDRNTRTECQRQTSVKQGRSGDKKSGSIGIVGSEMDPNINTDDDFSIYRKLGTEADLYNIRDVDLSYTSSISDGSTKRKNKLEQDPKKCTLQKRSSDLISPTVEHKTKSGSSPEHETKCDESPRQINSPDTSLEIIDLTGVDSSSFDDETESENEETKLKPSSVNSVIEQNENEAQSIESGYSYDVARKTNAAESLLNVERSNNLETHLDSFTGPKSPTVEKSIDKASQHCSQDLGPKSRKRSEEGVTTQKEHTRETSSDTVSYQTKRRTYSERKVTKSPDGSTESEKHEARDKENQSLRVNISRENNSEDSINIEIFGSTYNSGIMPPMRSDSGAFDLHFSDSESDETSSGSDSSVKTTISKAASIKVAEESTKDNETGKDDNQAINDSDSKHSTESEEKARCSKISTEDNSSETDSSDSSTTTTSSSEENKSTCSESKSENSSHSSSSDDDTLKDETKTTIPQNKTNQSAVQDMTENTDEEDTDLEEDMLQAELFDQNTNFEIVEAFNDSPHMRRIAEGHNAEESHAVEEIQNISTEQHQPISLVPTSSVQPTPNRAPKDPIFREPAEPINPPESESPKSNESTYWPFPLSEQEAQRDSATETAQAESGEEVSSTCFDANIIESTVTPPQEPFRVIQETPEAAIEEATIGGTFDIPTSPRSSGPACVENRSDDVNEDELIDAYANDVLPLEESSNTQVKESSEDDIVPK